MIPPSYSSSYPVPASDNSQAEVWLWRLGGILAIAAGLWMSLVFWYSLAERPADIPSHLCIALLTHVLIMAGGFSMVSGWREGRMGRVLLALLVAGVCFGLNVLNQSGFYANSSEIAAARAKGIDRLETLDDGAMKSGSARVDAARARLESLTKEQAALTGKGYITKARETYGKQIDTANAELQAASAALQEAQAGAKKTVVETKPEITGSASIALFKMLAHLTGKTPDDARAEFLFFLPFVHECLSLAGSIVLATFGRKTGRAVQLPAAALSSSTGTATAGASMARPIAAAGLAMAAPVAPALVPDPVEPPPADPPAASSTWQAPAPVMVPAASVPAAPATAASMEDYLRELFATWTSAQPQLVGRDAIGTKLGLPIKTRASYHRRVKASLHYQLSATNQPFSKVSLAEFAAAMPA